MKPKELNLALNYIDYCLISSPTPSGFLNSEDHLQEITLEFKSGFRDTDNYSESIGVIIGGESVKIVIALVISTCLSEILPTAALSKYQDKLSKLYDKRDKLIKTAARQINLQFVAQGMLKNQDYLVQSRRNDIFLQFESEASADLVNFRHKCVSSFSPAQLLESFQEEIESITGIRL